MVLNFKSQQKTALKVLELTFNNVAFVVTGRTQIVIKEK